MENNIWKVLGIEPTTDKVLIKQAYTRLVRENNPEEHPEEFQRIHSAYKVALMYAKAARTERTEETDAGEETSEEPQAVEASESEGADNDLSFDGIVPASDEEVLEEETPDLFDFSQLKETEITADNVNIMIEQMALFRRINKCDSFPSLIHMPPLQSKALVRNLLNRYTLLYNVTHDTRYITLFFEEPVVSLYSGDPKFVKWIGNSFTLPFYEGVRPFINESAAAVSHAHRYLRWESILYKRFGSPSLILKIVRFLLIVLMLLAAYWISKGFAGGGFR